MPQTIFEQSFLAIKKLVADFRENSRFYLTAAYQEQEARHDFIDKLFIALGWDVNHDVQKNPYAQEITVPVIRQIGAER
jgi:adenine-specific DNA-methyltransferase